MGAQVPEQQTNPGKGNLLHVSTYM